MFAGGHVRTGLEDNPHWNQATREPATNQRLVRRIAALAELAGRRLATGREVRAMLHLAPAPGRRAERSFDHRPDAPPARARHAHSSPRRWPTSWSRPGTHEVAGFVENQDRDRCAKPLLGKPVLWVDDVEPLARDHEALCALGTNKRRAYIEHVARARLPLRDPSAPAADRVAKLVARRGQHRRARASWWPRSTTIGAHTILNRGVLVGHHTRIGDYVTVSPGANVAGKVTVGDGAYIGMGAIVLDRLTSGDGRGRRRRLGGHARRGAGNPGDGRSRARGQGGGGRQVTSGDEYLVFGRPVIEEAEIAEVADSLRSGWIGTGPKVGRFERMLEEYTGVPHVRCVRSCTAALPSACRRSASGPATR